MKRHDLAWCPNRPTKCCLYQKRIIDQKAKHFKYIIEIKRVYSAKPNFLKICIWSECMFWKYCFQENKYENMCGYILFTYHGFYPTKFFHDKVLTKQISFKRYIRISKIKFYHHSKVFEIKRIKENEEGSLTTEEWWSSCPTCSFKWQLSWFIQQGVTHCYFQEFFSSYRIMSLRRFWRMYIWGEVVTRCTLFPLTTVFPIGFFW